MDRYVDVVRNRVKELQKTHKIAKVCNQCFKQKCNCENKCLIDIDRQMTGIVKTLNKKGYKTMYCCESHFKYSLSIYVGFIKNYFNDMEIPEGFKYSKKKYTIEHIITSKNRKDENKFNEEKQYYINILKEWVKNL